MSDNPHLPYAGTAGFVRGSDTSFDRAQREASNGAATHRQMLVMELLDKEPLGLTWKELSLLMGLHHGQISGALSVLHKMGKVAQLRTKRGNCHPYLSMRLADQHPLTELILTPSDTKAGQKRKAIDRVVEAARMVDTHMDLESCAALSEALRMLDAITNT